MCTKLKEKLMPYYDYKCAECGRIEEHLRSFSDIDPVFCIKCGQNTVKVITSHPIHFKGSGFYETDYKGKK